MPHTPSTSSRTRRLLRLLAVRQRVGLGPTSIYKLMKEGRFPQPVRALGTRTSAWVEAEIDDWIADQIAQRDAAAAPPADKTSKASSSPAATTAQRSAQRSLSPDPSPVP